MLYAPEYRFIFTHITRTGGVAFTNSLHSAGLKIEPLGEQHAPLCEAKAYVGDAFDALFKASIVRNPWDRLASWNSMIAKTLLGEDAEPAAIADPDAEHWQAFDGFVEDILNETRVIDGETRRTFSQFHQLSDASETLLTDYIGRFEAYPDSVASIAKQAGFSISSVQRINASNHHHYSAYYSDAAKEMVAEAVASDIEAFGYWFEDNYES